ncbi:MAG: type I methionyl aminopeptidase [Proteocatella sp.]|jgi:methionyl aminopeptidase|nr:type I methionyl aminopeptidase [Proteocatella sp.]MBP9658324.1 type I methionyl aminopeptidase [Proteocatella sp.]MBP9966148.1 type I methionyl aminopeptidase [Proteocatella sp.]
MIILKSKKEIEFIREAGKIVAYAHELLREAIKPGISTFELDEIAYRAIVKHNASPSFKGYGGFPASICASKNDVVVHGIPRKDDILMEGDIISIDIGAEYKGYHGDAAKTHPVGKITEDDARLIRETRESFYKGIEQALVGKRLSDISHAIQSHVEEFGFSVVREFVGHGVGRSLHEDPQIPNYGPPDRGPRLESGMVLAIEPMINQGTYKVQVLEDGWTVKTIDGKKSSHYEHTIAITDNGPDILTKL